MASVLDVAEYILRKQGRMSTWKLQKLVYYAQAWHAVWEGEELFSARIEAWANGPVCRKLYNAHKGEFAIATVNGNPDKLKKRQKESIDTVLNFYGRYNGQQLSDLTHSEDPWKKARKGLPPLAPGNREITLESMALYYESLPA